MSDNNTTKRDPRSRSRSRSRGDEDDDDEDSSPVRESFELLNASVQLAAIGGRLAELAAVPTTVASKHPRGVFPAHKRRVNELIGACQRLSRDAERLMHEALQLEDTTPADHAHAPLAAAAAKKAKRANNAVDAAAAAGKGKNEGKTATADAKKKSASYSLDDEGARARARARAQKRTREQQTSFSAAAATAPTAVAAVAATASPRTPSVADIDAYNRGPRAWIEHTMGLLHSNKSTTTLLSTDSGIKTGIGMRLSRVLRMIAAVRTPPMRLSETLPNVISIINNRFLKAGRSSSSSSTAPATTVLDDLRHLARLWDSVRDNSDVDELRGYVQRVCDTVVVPNP